SARVVGHDRVVRTIPATARATLDEIEEENLGRLPRCQRHGGLLDERRAVPRLQQLIAQLNASVHQVEPSPSARGKLVNEMMAPLEDRRINPCVLPQPQRRIPAVAGEEQPEDPPPLREREAFLLSGSLENASVRGD